MLRHGPVLEYITESLWILGVLVSISAQKMEQIGTAYTESWMVSLGDTKHRRKHCTLSPYWNQDRNMGMMAHCMGAPTIAIINLASHVLLMFLS